MYTRKNPCYCVAMKHFENCVDAGLKYRKLSTFDKLCDILGVN